MARGGEDFEERDVRRLSGHDDDVQEWYATFASGPHREEVRPLPQPSISNTVEARGDQRTGSGQVVDQYFLDREMLFLEDRPRRQRFSDFTQYW